MTHTKKVAWGGDRVVYRENFDLVVYLCRVCGMATRDQRLMRHLTQAKHLSAGHDWGQAAA